MEAADGGDAELSGHDGAVRHQATNFGHEHARNEKQRRPVEHARRAGDGIQIHVFGTIQDLE